MDGDDDALALSRKRILLRITVLGPGGAGKTSLITQLVNHIGPDRHDPTPTQQLFYATLSLSGNEEEPDAPKFNTLLEIEDTPNIKTMADGEMPAYYCFWWPKEDDEAMQQKVPKDKPEKDKEAAAALQNPKKMRSVNLPFSQLYAPVGKYNDLEFPLKTDDRHHGVHFCGEKDKSKRWEGKDCAPTTQRGTLCETDHDRGHQCGSCRRFDKFTSAVGMHREFRPMSRNRMAFLFVFDATSSASYIEVLRRYNDFIKYHDLKRSKLKPVVYLVGNKTDQEHRLDTEGDARNDYASITGAIDEFIRQQDEEGYKVSKAYVSAMQYKGVAKLFRNVVSDLKTRESLWQLDAGDENHHVLSGQNNCTLQ